MHTEAMSGVPTPLWLPPKVLDRFLAYETDVGGRIKTSQWGSNQNQPLFFFKPVGVVFASGDLGISRQIQR